MEPTLTEVMPLQEKGVDHFVTLALGMAAHMKSAARDIEVIRDVFKSKKIITNAEAKAIVDKLKFISDSCVTYLRFMEPDMKAISAQEK